MSQHSKRSAILAFNLSFGRGAADAEIGLKDARDFPNTRAKKALFVSFFFFSAAAAAMIECFVLWLLPPPPPWGETTTKGKLFFCLRDRKKGEENKRSFRFFPGKEVRREKGKVWDFLRTRRRGKEEEEEELNKWLFPLFSWEKKKFSPLIKLLLRRKEKKKLQSGS